MASGELGASATLIIGAVGAISAIFLKEAVQAAMQRRIVSWQLLGYLMQWRSLIVKHAPMVSIYETVKKRNYELVSAAGRGNSEFQRVHSEQVKERSEMREKVKEVIIDAISKADLTELGESFHSVLITETAASLSEQRKLLADSKTFISDRDAATLGKQAAMNVVQFRSSLLYLLGTMEGLFKLIPHKSEKSPTTIANFVDQMILYGEELLVAMIRLESKTEAISKQSLHTLTLEILRGR
jgi:hypothetical protein